MIRDILNYLGEKIGELELPDGTPENVWAEKLAFYAIAPKTFVPEEITPRQIRLALVLSGIAITQVDFALASLPEEVRPLAQIEWEYSIGFARSHYLIPQVASLLGWTESQVDDLWIFGASL